MNRRADFERQIGPIRVDLLRVSYEFSQDAEARRDMPVLQELMGNRGKLASVLAQAFIDVAIADLGSHPTFHQICQTRIQFAALTKIIFRDGVTKGLSEHWRDDTPADTLDRIYEKIARQLAAQAEETVDGDLLDEILSDVEEIDRANTEQVRERIEDEMTDENNDSDARIDAWEFLETEKELDAFEEEGELDDQVRQWNLEWIIRNILTETNALGLTDREKKKPLLALGERPDALHTLLQPELVIHDHDLGLRLLVTNVSPKNVRVIVRSAEDKPWLAGIETGDCMDFEPTPIPNMWHAKNININLSFIADQETGKVALYPARSMARLAS